ncbi:cation:proton antiporter [Gordonia sp. CPCC 205515]|uniref:cation:proton antiporter n=1 Tax=Gordonia sp. CPCC 205515 TaxID=3140791 RepID=UPI003AF3AF68
MMVLADAAAGETSAIVSLFWITVAIVAAPIIARILRGYVPDVVVLLILGMIVGPFALGWAWPSDVDIISQLGLGMLFLLAGYELDPDLVRGKSGRVARLTWLVSLAFALLVITLAAGSEDFTARIAVAIAVTSTALGTLLPILRQLGLLGKPLGRAVMAHGAVGEVGPILAMSLLLTSRSIEAAAFVLVLFGIAAVLIWAVPRRMLDRIPGIEQTIGRMAGGTTQMPVRIVVLLLVALMAVAAEFDLDVVLGAFAAGLILRELLGPEHPQVGRSLDVIGYGLFIPVFFVTSGMAIDVDAVLSRPWMWVLFVVAIVVSRGVPVWVSERFVPHGLNLPSEPERIQLALYASTGLPIIVAVTQFATDAGLMGQGLASTLVAAGATTVLVFPMLARWVGSRADRKTANAGPTQ